MFGGHTIVLVPVCGLTKPQSAVFAKRIASLGGIVVEVTKKGSYKAAISDATEIVSGPDLSDPLPSILPALGLSSPADIPSTTKVYS